MKYIFITVILCLGCAVVQAIAVSRSNLMTNEAIGQLPSANYPDNAAEYWALRTKAFGYARNKQWHTVIPLLKKLTDQYQDDGDTWFLLGHGYLHTQQYKKAILPLERALQLGTIVTGIEAASASSNDIMVEIAHCYSTIGNKPKALEWLQKAL